MGICTAGRASIAVCVAGLLLAGSVGFTLNAQQKPAGPSLPADPRLPLVEEYCVACHDEDKKKGNLALDTVAAHDVAQHPDVWEKVVRKLRARQMPPIGKERPDDATYDAVIASLEKSLDRAAAANPNPGRTATIRRLTRTEYQNAIRDLLELEVDATSLLPADEASYGFDNVTVGDLSPTLLDRYVSAAEKISRVAVGRPSRSPGGDTIRIPTDLTQEGHVDGLPIGTRGGAVVRYAFPLDGEYEITIRLARDRDEHVEGLSEPHDLELLLDRERVQLFTVQPPQRVEGFSTSYQPSHDNLDQHLKMRVPVKAGPHAVGVAFPKRPSALSESVRQPYQARFNSYRHPRIQPAIYSISIIGPYAATGPGETPSRRRLFVSRPATPAEDETSARRILSALMRRAYRRPVSEADLQGPLALYRKARTDGDFEAGIEMALSAVLVSPQFLFRVEPDPAGTPPNTVYRISDLELASRLSFFLWSSIPDDELIDVASAGTLHEPAVLERQVRRMLADNRSQALVSNFASQWLHLRNLASITPDMRLFPDFDDNLRQAFRQETELFFESIVREDRSVLDLLDANFTFVNERLARQYGILNVYGPHFRRVTLPPSLEVRRGLLGKGALMTVTSNAARTSPVTRGKWFLQTFLGVAPPDPPPDVDTSLKEKPADVTGNVKVPTMRQTMEAHRANPTCASCHKIFEPLGFALENFDAVGAWRTHDEGLPVDATGVIVDGTNVDGVASLREVLVRYSDQFVRVVTEKLLIYALGRGVEYQDMPMVRSVVRDSAPTRYKFSSIVLGIVKSPAFQMNQKAVVEEGKSVRK
jgi:hypothetical protein